MGVIIDSGIQKEIDQLEATGAFSLADTFKQANEVSLESLVFMADVPPEYEALIANSSAYQAMRAQRDEKAKEDEQDKKIATERAAAYQREIDGNMLRFSIDGEDIQISQSDLRRLMQHRVEELEEQKKELLKNGGDPKELGCIDNLLNEYQPVIDDLQNHKADASTNNATRDVMEHDPTFLQEVKAAQHAENASPENATKQQSPTASPSLKNTFGQNAAPLVSPQPATAPSPNEQPQKTMKNAAAALGF